jgi:YD repeat-containing protein
MSGGNDGNAFTVIKNSKGDGIGLLPSNGKIPCPQSSSLPSVAGTAYGTEPVTHNGEFIVEETDVNYPGFGIPFTFTRYYRSGIKYQTPLGFGWNHNFARRLVEAVTSYDAGSGCSTAQHDVFYINEQMNRIRFAYQATSADGNIDYYSLRDEGNGLQLYKDRTRADAPWTLRDRNGTIYRFDADWGTLSSISDLAGHTVRVEWDHSTWQDIGGKVASVTDTTGRRIHFIYQTTQVPNPYLSCDGRLVGPQQLSFEFLQCLSLTPDCSAPLVSFQMKPIRAKAQLRNAPNCTTNWMEFDLIRVLDAQGDGPTYGYHRPTELEYQATFEEYFPSRELRAACTKYCGDSGFDCHNIDICLSTYNAAMASCEQFTENTPFGYQKRFNMCMSTTPSDWGSDYSLYQFYYDQCKALSKNGANTSLVLNYVNQCKVNANISLPDCRNDCLSKCLSLKAAPNNNYAFGLPPELYHNLTRIQDGDGRLVVENTYGEDPFSPSFDRVIKHVLGQGTDNVMTFEYHDLHVESTPQGKAQPFSSFVTPLGSFEAVNVCPRTCINSHTVYDPIRKETHKICDEFGNSYEAVERFNGPKQTAQAPAHAVVVHDIHGVVRTTYHDSFWRLLREVNHTASLTVDYNYKDGWLHGVLRPAGDRMCVESDALGKPIRITQLAAPGYPGISPSQVSEFTYDENQQLLQVVHNPDTSTPAGRQFNRDRFARITAIGDQIDSLHTRWTCFDYVDPVTPLSVVPASLLGTAEEVHSAAMTVQDLAQIDMSLLTPATNNHFSRRRHFLPASAEIATSESNTIRRLEVRSQGMSNNSSSPASPTSGVNFSSFVGLSRGLTNTVGATKEPAADPLLFPGIDVLPKLLMFYPSGCAASSSKRLPFTTVPVPPGAFQRRDVSPSVITRPDGSTVLLTDISVGGPGKTTIDAAGPDPVQVYQKHDQFGRQTEVGRISNGANAYPGSASRAIFGPIDLVQTASVQDPNTGDWVDTTLSYDKSHHIVGVKAPSFQRDIVVDSFGQTKSITDTPLASDPHHTQPRRFEFNYDAQGRPLSKAFPDGNFERYVYDGAGRLHEIWKGGNPQLTIATGSPATVEKLAAFDYDNKGFPSGELRDGVYVKFIVDGFGRIIDRLVPDPPISNPLR